MAQEVEDVCGQQTNRKQHLICLWLNRLWTGRMLWLYFDPDLIILSGCVFMIRSWCRCRYLVVLVCDWTKSGNRCGNFSLPAAGTQLWTFPEDLMKTNTRTFLWAETLWGNCRTSSDVSSVNTWADVQQADKSDMFLKKVLSCRKSSKPPEPKW